MAPPKSHREAWVEITDALSMLNGGLRKAGIGRAVRIVLPDEVGVLQLAHIGKTCGTLDRHCGLGPLGEPIIYGIRFEGLPE